MNKKPDLPTSLNNPNDVSHGQCYAPLENGAVNKQKKKHIPEGKDAPSGWKQVACDAGCTLRK
jgi:hypothetical protein